MLRMRKFDSIGNEQLFRLQKVFSININRQLGPRLRFFTISTKVLALNNVSEGTETMFFLERIFILACTSLLFTPPTAAMFPKGRSSALVYGLNYKARALDSQQQTRKNCFLIGTLTLSEQNQVRRSSSRPT